MPRQCATGPQYGAMPDPWSPAVRKYINDGLDDETLAKSPSTEPQQPPSSLDETVEGIKNGTLSGATLNMNGTAYDGVGIAVGVNNMATISPQSLSSEKVNSLKQQFMAGHSPVEKIGFWVDENNEVSIDLSLVLPPEQMELAKTIGTYTRQNSIYDIETDVETKLGFSGNNNRDLTLEELNVVREMIEELSMRTNSPEDISKAENILDYLIRNNHYSRNINTWRDIRKADAAQRKEAGRLQGKLLDAAIQVMEGKMTIPQFRKISQDINPIIPITEVPTTASLTDMARALSKNKSIHKRIMGLPNINLRDGEAVELRLDIPAYELYNVWVNAIHLAGQRNMYSNTSVGNNAIFGDEASHRKAIKVAAGTSKGPFARIAVSWENRTVEQTEQEIAAALQESQQENSTWKQIGFNPTRSGYFYDKANLKPVASATRVLQLGPLVMAQNVQYVPTREAKLKLSPSEPKKQWGENLRAALAKLETPDYAQQRALNIIPPLEAVIKKGVKVLQFKDARTKLTRTKENDDHYGRFYHYIYKNARPEAWQALTKWGTPTIIIWDENATPIPDVGDAFYSKEADMLYQFANPKPSAINGKTLVRHVEQSVLHEFMHFADAQFGKISMGTAFEEAYNRDGIDLGILFPMDSYYRDFHTRLEMDKSTMEYTIDDETNNFIFYNHMLHNPNDLKALEDLLNKTRATYGVDSLEERQVVWDSNVNIPMPDGMKHILNSQKGMNSKAFEDFWKGNERMPTNAEMIDQIETSHNIRQEGIQMGFVLKKRDELFNILKKEYRELAHEGSYMHGYYDIIDAMTGGQAREQKGIPGHGEEYYETREKRLSEVFANLGEAWANIDQRAWTQMKMELPKLTAEFERIMEANKDKIIPSQNPQFDRRGGGTF